MIFLMPINTVIFSIVSKQRRKVLQYSDLRVKTMNEILNGIRIIKFYAWERPFGKEVSRIRQKELDALTRLAYTSAIGFSLILLSAPIIQPILVFLTYVAIQDEPLDAATAFTTVALFNIMRFPFAFLPMGLLQYIQSKISLRRLERYFDLPELASYVQPTPPPPSSSQDDKGEQKSEAEFGSITVRNGTFTWIDPDGKPIRPIQDIKPKKEKKDKKSKKDDEKSKTLDIGTSSHSNTSMKSDGSLKGPTITLHDLDFHIPAGSIVAVVGQVGSGKSSFLSALLGEMEPIHDSKVYMPQPDHVEPGFVSYCAQTPWVVNDTLRGNVLFGREYIEERYNHVIEVCALLDDLAVLPAGDMTEIGERGINLSGGQKARVSLARALYSSDTKIVCLDDVLSAVDAHVGEHIFSKAIMGEISNGLTRILVTHHVHLLSRCDSVIFLENGRIKHQGPYHVLVEQGVDFAGAIDVSKVAASHKLTEEDAVESTETIDAKETSEIASNDNQAKTTAGNSDPIKKDDEVAGQLTEKTKDVQKEAGKKLVSSEEREEGSVSGSAYIHYARAGGLCLVASMFIIQAIGRGCEVMGGFWLAIWADSASDGQTRGEQKFYVAIYGLFGMLSIIGLTVRAIIIAQHRLGASKLLHDDLVSCILRAPGKCFYIQTNFVNESFRVYESNLSFPS